MHSSKKAAKKARKIRRAHEKEKLLVVCIPTEEELKELAADNERLAILSNPSLSYSEKCDLVFRGALPEIFDDGATTEVTNIRKEAVELFAYYIIKFATILGENDTVNALTYNAYVKLHEEESKALQLEIKKQVANEFDKMTEFIVARNRGDFEEDIGRITFEGNEYLENTTMYKVRFQFGYKLTDEE